MSSRNPYLTIYGALLLTFLFVALFITWWAAGIVLLLMLSFGAFTKCNVCKHPIKLDARGKERDVIGDHCARCGAGIENVYPFSYLRKRKNSS